MAPSPKHWPHASAGVSYDGLPDAARHWAKVAIMDTVGCILAGADELCARIAGRVAAIGGANGPCVVFGTADRVGPMDAAADQRHRRTRVGL